MRAIMRIAVIADIHGNLEALRAVLADAEQRGAEYIVVNGDVVNRGPDSVAALEELLAREDVTFLQGNHDDLVWLWQSRSDRLPPEWFRDPFWVSTAWNAEALDRAGLLEVPQGWPLAANLGELLGLPELPPALIAHGTPQNYREGISDRMKPARLQEVAGSYPLVIGSHIHRPVIHRAGPVLAVNSGSVGVSADGDTRAAYLLLTLQGGPAGAEWQPEIVRVDYDLERSLHRFTESGYLDTGLSAEIFRQELQTGRSIYTPYWAWTEGQGLARTPKSWAAWQHTLAAQEH